MPTNFNSKFSLNKFLKNIQLKKQYLNQIKKNVQSLNKLKETNYKAIGSRFFLNNIAKPNSKLIMYIIDISFSKKNVLLHISDSSGNIKFFYSGGALQQEEKASKVSILRKFYRILVSKLKFLRKKPLAIHLKNPDSNMFWFLKKLKKKLFITVVKSFNLYPYNGCRKKKIRRKKFKSRSIEI